jgi:hypothetical protein
MLINPITMTQQVKFIEVPVADIQLLEKNPRIISDEEFEKLVEDIKSDPNFLMQRPPLLNLADGVYYCYAGTQRTRVAGAIGKDKIFCFVEENVPEHIQDERMLKDNLHRGQWDEQKLLELNIDLSIMSDFGFKDFEVSIFSNMDLEEPKDLTAPYKEAPPTMKVTFTDAKQMAYFEGQLKILIDTHDNLSTLTYSVSQGEI